MIHTVAQDLRYALRVLSRSPGFAFLSVLTMAIGIGANAAIFTIVNAVLIRPLPFTHPDELYLVNQTNTQTGQPTSVTGANFLDWRARSRAFASLAAFRDEPFVVGSEPPERVNGAIVNGNFFDVLGVRPALGRTFAATDEQRGARVALLSDGLWRERFGADRGVIGSTLQLNGEPHTIVGVMPPGIDFPDRARLWTPPHWRVPDDPLAMASDPAGNRSHGYFFVLGRVKPGVARAAAAADIASLASALEREYPSDNMQTGGAVTPLVDDLVGDVRPMLQLLMTAVGLVLLIATANVSALLIARATSRTQEVAIRLALGASRARIVAQLLTESVLLAFIGGAGGILLALWLVAPLVALSPRDFGAAGAIRIDATVLAFAVIVSTAAGIVFGLAPARQLLGVDLHRDLKQSTHGMAAVGQRRLRAALVAGEVALSMVLLVGAGLTIRSFVRVLQVSPGFDARDVVTTTITLPDARYPTPQQRGEFWERAIAAFRGMPGVEAVGASSRLPLSGGNSTRGIVVDGNLDPAASLSADYRTASPDYFRSLGIPLLRGRGFDDGDRDGRPLTTIVSASLAQRLWKGGDAIGHHIAIDPERPMTVVGVVGDVHHASLEAAVQPTFYTPYRQDARPTMTFALRTRDGADVRAGIAGAIRNVDKEQPVGAIRSMDDAVARSLAQRRLGVTLLAGFGGIAVLLAGIGLYGVLAFIVAQRRREIGVRMALGARPRDVVADVLGNGVRLAIVGLAIGAALAIAATKLLGALLFGISPTDLLTFAAASALIVAIAVMASLVPALRASRVDPLVALRES